MRGTSLNFTHTLYLSLSYTYIEICHFAHTCYNEFIFVYKFAI